MFLHKNKKGQSTLEYVLLVTGVIVALIAFTQSEKYGMKKALKGTLEDSTTAMGTMSGRLSNSYGSDTLTEESCTAAGGTWTAADVDAGTTASCS